jgi:acyl-CoA thioesterase-1
LYNFAIAGRQAVSAGEDAQKAAAVHPDLAIVAYGMNDVGRRNPGAYRDEIVGAMNTLKSVNPEVEFVLVSSMLGNSEWSSLASDQFIPYRDILKSLTGQGVALADMTALWIDLLKLKKFHDLTGNGVNHPNDFGHRLYAQVILTLLIQQESNPYTTLEIAGADNISKPVERLNGWFQATQTAGI